MNIIITVNFSNENFNKDYQLSCAMLSRHTILLVSNIYQLDSAKNDYDIILVGQSSFDFDQTKYKNTFPLTQQLLDKLLD